MATMQLQMQGQTRQVVARSAPRAFVAAPVSRKVAVQRSAAAAPISRSRTVVKATAEAKEAAPAATGRQVSRHGLGRWGLGALRACTGG